MGTVSGRSSSVRRRRSDLDHGTMQSASSRGRCAVTRGGPPSVPACRLRTICGSRRCRPRSDCCLGKGTDGPQDRGSPRLCQSWLRNGFVPRGVAARGGANTSATGPRHTTPVHGGKRVAVATFATQTRRGESPGGQEAAQSRGLPGLEVGLDGLVSWLSGDGPVGCSQQCGNRVRWGGLCHVVWQFGAVQTHLPQESGPWWSGRDSSDHICHARW